VERRTIRRPFRAGHVFWIRPGSTRLNKDKPRPFVLATSCTPGERATLVYGSTQAAERVLGAACVEVVPRRDGVNRNGLRARTYVYAGILVRTRYSDLPPDAGSLGRSLDALRVALRIALGIGQGSCTSPAAPPGSRRGRIVVLKPDVAAGLRTRFGVLLTEPSYSRAKNYHVVLPMYPGDERQPGTGVLQVRSRRWLAVFSPSTTLALLALSATQSFWYGGSIERETEYVVDEDTLTEIDRRLCEYFSLPGSDSAG
jgi:hypothetical protein